MHLFRFTFFMMLSLAASSLFAQAPQKPGSVSGKIVDNNNNPVAYATVTLLKPDSSVVNGDLTKDDGSFNITGTGIGNFRLKIESIGVKTKTIDITVSDAAPDKNLGNVKVDMTASALKEVSIVGEKPIMELKVDKKVFNVEKNTTTAGGSATDVLQNVPSVSVDADGNVALRGKTDVTILIDGKPATLLGSDVTSALQSLPAGSIESVEVITNPSAKYDAQGTSGIINIITKKDGRFGVNGTATLGAGTHDKYNGNFGLNVRKGKWNVFLNSSARLNRTFNDVTTNRVDSNGTSFHTFEHVPRKFNGVFNTIGATFDPDKNNSITLTENVNVMGFAFKDYSDYYTYSDANFTPADTITHQNRYSDFAVNLFSLSSALDYKHKFKKKDEELSVDGTFANTNFNRHQQYVTTNYPITSYPVTPTIEDATAMGNNSTLNVWADYTDPLFTKNGKLGLGFKSQVYWFNSADTTPTETIGYYHGLDTSLLTKYNYSQQIHAAYVNWNDQIGKFSYQAGVRFEDAIYNGTGLMPISSGLRDTSFTNSFVNLFPSAFISYQLENQQSIYLNYSYRTNRPNFFQLLPYVDLSNPGTVNTGNPNLLPEFINNVEFSYSKATTRGDNFILSAYYAYTTNLIEKVTTPITPDQAVQYGVSQSNLFSKPVNIASGTTYGLEGTGHIQILPIWDATVNLNFFQNQLEIGNVDTAARKYLNNNSGFTWFGKVNTNIKLPANFSLQFNGNYESPKVIAQGNLKETWWLDVALRKNFWKNKATLIINCSDIFKTHNFVTTYNLSAYNETIDRVKETRIGNITFTYRFGKTDQGKQGAGGRRSKNNDNAKPAKPGDEDRENNLKQGDDDNGGGGGMGNGGSNSGGKGGGSRN